jgi:hypothetical protein
MTNLEDYETKKFFEEGAEASYHYEDPATDKLAREIIFLYRKLKNFESKIEKSYEDFIKSIINRFEGEARKQIKDVKKDYSDELKVKHTFLSSQADNDLFFYLDSFLIDLKRIVEFTFKLIAKFEGLKEIKNFSLEKLIGWISGEIGDTPSNLSKILEKKYEPYVEFILSKKRWLKSLNYRRTQTMHYEIFNKSGSFKIEYVWNSVMKKEDKPIINFPDMPFFYKPILQFTKEEMKNLREFLGVSLGLRKDLMKKTKLI